VIADIWRVSADGGQAIRLTRNGGFEPRESPDGRYLFYLDRPPAGVAIGGTARLMRLPLGGGQEELVLDRVRPFLPPRRRREIAPADEISAYAEGRWRE
jgi:hypothetical protein